MGSKIADLERRVAEAERLAEISRISANTAIGYIIALRVTVILQAAGLRPDDPAAGGIIDRLMTVPPGKDGGMRADVLGSLKQLAGEIDAFRGGQKPH